MLLFLIDFIWCSLSALLTSLLINKYSKCAVQASSGVSLLMCLVSYTLVKDSSYFPIIFGGSFIGMSLFKKFHPFEIVIASSFFSLIYLIMIKQLPPIGGVLGLGAFISLGIINFNKFLFLVLKKATRFKWPR